MTDDISDIVSYYDADPEHERARLDHHQLEYDLTWRYLERFLPPQGSVLEVGAATGKYTVGLARRGYSVTAVDLSARLLEVCSRNLSEACLVQRVRLVLADARDLSPVGDQTFDAVLLMGPLYHLVVESDRQSALRQAYNRLSPGGFIFSSFISRFGILGDLITNVPGWIENQEEVRGILELGMNPYHVRGSGFRGYFARVSEIAPLHESVGFETVALAGVEPAISADDECYNRLERTQRRLWLDVLNEVSTEASIMAASRHLLYVGRVPRDI